MYLSIKYLSSGTVQTAPCEILHAGSRDCPHVLDVGIEYRKPCINTWAAVCISVTLPLCLPMECVVRVLLFSFSHTVLLGALQMSGK